MKVHYDQRYESLLEVYRLSGYSAAGAVLGLTPSAVAQQIHSVERELETVLFINGDKKLIPTRECEIVVEYVKNIHSLCEQMEDAVDFSRHQLKHLTVGVTPSVESFAFSRVLVRYGDSRPDTQITVRTESAAQLCELLKNGVIDLAVVEENCPEDDFRAIILDTDFLTVVVPCDSEYARRGMITAEELQKESLILRPSKSGTRNLFEANLKSAGLSLNQFRVMMEVDSISTVKKLVSEGYGLSVLSNKACIRDVAAGKIRTIPLVGISMTRSIRILCRKDFDNDVFIKEIQKHYTHVMRELEGDSEIPHEINEEKNT